MIQKTGKDVVFITWSSVDQGGNLWIIPVPKPAKDRQALEGYRLVSLGSTFRKVLETLLLTRMNEHLDEHHLLDDEQFTLWCWT
ncbi:hypothetical protein Trydic_g3940 [Trypoxylus dichotomus]